ncbi:MAG: DNA mismatch repair protein MutS [Burkholderiales bacterium]|nr:DNA mismatch repair protein MutS [Burkholderiales bacterium]
MPKDADRDLFLEAVKDAIPLPPGNRADTGKKRPVAKRIDRKEEPVPDFLSDHPHLQEGEHSFCRPGLSRELRKLRKARVQFELDLHGLTSDEARVELLRFIAQAAENGIRFARVVHGKGYGSKGAPVLKSKVGNWLVQIPSVLAFCEAGPGEGGSGALVLLIKSLAKDTS